MAKHVEDCPDIGPACSSATPPAPYVHDVTLTIDETVLDAAYGLLPWLALEARVGARLVVERAKYYTLEGEPHPVDDGHHRNETLFGPTDPWLALRTGARAGHLLVTSRFGLSFPLGSTEEDPYQLGARGLPHEHIQIGTGTFEPLVGAALTWIDERFEAQLAALGQMSLYENRKGYFPPSHLFLAARATLPLDRFRPYAEGDLAHDGRELWHGVEGTEGSTVRSDVLVGGGIAWTFLAPWQVDLGFRVRVARLTDSATLEYPALFTLAIATSWDPASHADAEHVAEPRVGLLHDRNVEPDAK